ncbi:hypothetical protein Hdeb2414_s0001g00004291 [Helianthus debilis subsp. tardiflorus]
MPSSIYLDHIKEMYPGLSTQRILNLWSSLHHNNAMSLPNGTKIRESGEKLSKQQHGGDGEAYGDDFADQSNPHPSYPQNCRCLIRPDLNDFKVPPAIIVLQNPQSLGAAPYAVLFVLVLIMWVNELDIKSARCR